MTPRLFLLFSFLSLLIGCTKSPDFDLIIKNGLVFTGNGEVGVPMDIGIRGDRIQELGNLERHSAQEIIDATGLVVTPGFIDMHAHLEPLPSLPMAESLLRQGVTLALGGPDGGSPLPLGAFLDSLSRQEIGVNVAYLVGHNSIRKKFLGLEDRPPSPDELEKMKAETRFAMEAGAFGISTGLKYLPGTFAQLDELVALSQVVSERNGLYSSHLREEGIGLIEAVAEAIEIAGSAQLPVLLTHHKALGVAMWGASNKTLALVDSARSQGLDILLDQYPYTASHTSLSVLIPSWAMEGGKFHERVQSPELKDRIKADIIHNILNNRGGEDLRRIQFSAVSWNPKLEGKTLHDWLIQDGLTPTLENGAEYIIQAQLNGGTGTIYHAMAEADVERIMKHPQTMIASDGRLSRLGQGHPHPRAYGTFPRVLGLYVREKNVLDLQTAIYKMTGLPAKNLGLHDRGTLRVGNFADICILDPLRVKDKSTFLQPHQYPEGIEYVLVNGKISLRKGVLSGEGQGRVIRKNHP